MRSTYRQLTTDKETPEITDGFGLLMFDEADEIAASLRKGGRVTLRVAPPTVLFVGDPRPVVKVLARP